MATGQKVPTVLFARFTSLVGAASYSTTPIDVVGFTSLQITFHRGPVTGTNPSFSFKIEESVDLGAWQDLGAAVLEGDVAGEGTESHEFTPTRRYVRCTATIGGTDNPSTTLWAMGYVERTMT